MVDLLLGVLMITAILVGLVAIAVPGVCLVFWAADWEIDRHPDRSWPVAPYAAMFGYLWVVGVMAYAAVEVW